MIALLLVLAPSIYGFAPDTRLDYDVKVLFDGFIPVLGGQEGKVEVQMGVKVDGLSPEQGNQRAASEIKRFKILFNGAELPLTLDNVQDYFPRTTISVTPYGRILKTDAPDLSLPVRLPGLDAKRFPDITYLPIEFPESETLTKGTKWEFRKSFDGSDIVYTCEATKVDDAVVEVDLKMTQSYSVLENAAKEVVKDRQDAVASVDTKLDGSGRVIFDRKAGVVKAFSASATAVSNATDLKTKLESRRVLKTTLEVGLQEKVATQQKPETLLSKAQGIWNSAVSSAGDLWSRAKGLWLMARVALGTASATIGLPLGHIWDRILGK